MNRLRNCFLLALCVLSLVILPVYAQKTTGTILGTVTDPSGAVVPNAPVTVLNAETGLTRTTTTDAQGNYSFPELTPGTYDVRVKAQGFKESVTRAVELHVSSISTVNAKLQLGQSNEVLEVAANAIQVQTDNASLGEVIDSTQVKELPLNGRSFVQLTQLAPGVSGANNFDSKNKGLQGGVDFSVNGNPTTNNLFLIDGANNNDVGSNRTILIYPSVDSIAEFKMLQNSYGAEYGQASGAVVSIVTKSGTNAFHGDVFYAGRNDALSAYEYFSSRAQTNYNNANPNGPSKSFKDKLRANDFGFAIGGPIKKDKLFFFASEEWNRTIRGITKSSCVPTAAERAGDFTNTSCGVTQPDFSTIPGLQLGTDYKLDANGKASILLHPNPVAGLLISKYPLPNIGASTWAASLPSKLNWREDNFRGDWHISKSNTLMGRFTQDTWVNPSPTGGVYWGDDAFPTLNSSWAQPSKSIATKLTSTIGNSIVNDVEFAYSNNRINITPAGNTQLLQQITDAIPTLYPSSLKTSKLGIPTIWGAFGNYGNGASGGNYWMIAPWNNSLDIYTVRDDISKVSGNHTFKAGAFFGYSGKNELNSTASNERPTFATGSGNSWMDAAKQISANTGNNLANLMVPGALWNLSENSTNWNNQLRWRDSEFYFADTWKAMRNLTVDLGIRYSLLNTPYNPNNQFTAFQPWLYDPSKPSSDACNGLWTVPGTDPCAAANKQFGTSYSTAVAGPNKYLRDQNHHLFAPRVGLAWDPTGNGNWAVRAGIGQFFQRERVSPFFVMSNNAPFVVNGNMLRTINGPTPASLGGSASPAGGMNPTADLPNSWQWNLSVQHSFAKDTVLQVGYVGNRGIHLTSNYDINFIPQQNWLAAAFASGGDQNKYRPYSNFGSLNYWDRNGDSNYHALQMSFKTRYKRSQLSAAYTYSHSISNVLLDDSSGGAGNANFTDPSNPGLDRGNSPINRPHIFVANATFFLPDLKGSNGFVRNTLGGWELNVIQTAESGNSTTMYQGGIGEYTNNVRKVLCSTVPGCTDDPNKLILPPGAGSLNAQIGTGYNNPLRPAITGDSCTAGRNGSQIYNPGAFTMVGWQIGSIPGNMEPRGYCRGPKLVNTDFSVDKNWKLTERIGMQLRVDFFNLFNHPNFRGDQGSFGLFQGVNCGSKGSDGFYAPCSPTNNLVTSETRSSDFGQSNQTVSKSGREIQYGLKIIF